MQVFAILNHIFARIDSDRILLKSAFIRANLSIWEDASQIPTETHFVPLTNQGKTVYITLAQNYLYTLLFRTAFIGGSALFVAAFVFEAFGVSVFPETKI
ncbi:MAG TPA: hypothetical protein VF596_14515 [Pyrinomonadaceae bacterium]